MTSVYLQSDDYAVFGVPGTTANAVIQASTLLDGYLKRPEGLVWTPDAGGAPCYMAGLAPAFAFTLQADIAPGLNVVANVSGPTMMLEPGSVLVLDRVSPETVEACVVVAIAGQAITLQSVSYAHAAGAVAESGLVIEEQRYAPSDRPLVLASRTPLMRIISGVGRYGYGRRGDGLSGLDDFNLLAALSKFGGPPAWELFSPLNTGIDPGTGQIWIPAGVLLAYYSEVKLRYVAGFSAAQLPAPIKFACAGIIKATAAQAVPTSVKSYQAGDTKVENFVASVLDQDLLASLSSYAARMMY